MATQTPLKIAIIGGGLIGPRHAASVRKNAHCILTALVEPSPKGPETAAALNTTLYTSIAALVSSPHKPDAAIVCTPNSTHVALSKELASAGVHVLVEKPISTDLESGASLIAHARACGIQLLVGHHRRFNPYIVSTKTALAAASLGTVLAVSGIWAAKKTDAYFLPPTDWRQAETAGVVLINLVHEVDLLQYLFGPIVRIMAEPTRKTRGYDADEGAAIIFRFESGVVGTFVVSDAAPSPYNFEAGTGENPTIPKVEKERGAGGFYRILGTAGSLSVSDMTMWSYPSEGSWTDTLESSTLPVDIDSIPFDEQIHHLVQVIRHNEEPVCSGIDGLSALVVCEGIARAMESGMPVDLDTVGI